MKKIQSITPLVLFMTLSLAGMLEGQYYFGRNKVHYHQFRWQILKTRHFDIYFYPEMEELAEIGASFAEVSYQYLQDKFNHTVLRRIPLVFYSTHFHFEQTNTLPYLIPPGVGGFFEFMKGRVVVPSDGNLDHFRRVIRHELVHVFQKSYVSRILKDHRILTPRSAPLWFTEGLAEYWAEDWDPEAEMVIRDAVLNHTILPIHQMDQIYGTFLMYKQGQSILKFIAEQYGDEKILRLMQNIWKAETFNEVMEMTLGKDYKALSEAWLYALKKRMYPLLDDKDLPRMVTLKITDRGYNIMPVFYRDGKKPMVVFVANRDGYSSLYWKPIVDHEEKKPELLLKGENTADLESFHMQRSRIDVDQRGRIVFVAKSGPQDVIYIYDIRQRKIVSDYRFPRVISIFSPSWSPDGERIAFTGLDRAGWSDLYVLDLKSAQLRRLINDHYDDRDPDWSPDGRMLVFSSDRTSVGRDGYRNLFLFNLDHPGIRYLTFGHCRDESPSWAPDGKTIAFSSDRDGVSNVWALTLRHRVSDGLQPTRSDLNDGVEASIMPTEPIQLTHFATGGFNPAWTDSMDLLLTAFEKVGFQIRFLERPKEKLKALRRIASFPDVEQDEPWYFPRLEGDVETSRIRYRRKFSLDFAQSQVIQDPIYGTSGGGQIVVTDMLGDEQYYFLLFNTAQTRSEFWDGFNIAVTRVDLSRRVNYAMGLYRLAGRYYNRYEGYFYENRYGGFGSISYPLNQFNRVETNLNIRYSEKDWTFRSRPREAFLLSNFVSFTRDNSLWGPTGPMDGERMNFTLGNTVDVIHSNVNFTTVMFDVRKYFRLGARIAHAVRLWGQFNQGKEALPFFMGGAWDLRGYRLWSLWGTKLFLISNEFRFPFLDQFYLGFPFGGIGFSSIRGALFVDAGNVWDDDFGELKGSLGFGIRFRLGGYLVLRLDVGRRTNFKRIERETFTQFFFGWDF